MRRLAAESLLRRTAAGAALLLACLLTSLPLRAEEVLTNEDVVKLVESGLPLDLVKEKIEDSENAFDDSTEALVELKNRAVPDEIIRLMHREASKKRRDLQGKISLQIQRLTTARPEIRTAAMDFLRRNRATALPEIRETLVHERPELRAAAAEAAASLGDRESLQTLRTLLLDTEREVRHAAAGALFAMEDEIALDLARQAVVGGGDPLDGYLDLLGLHEDAEALGFIQLRLLESASEMTRARAAWALGRIGQARIHKELEHTLLRDSSPVVRREAAVALGRLAVAESAEALMLACSADLDVRLQSLRALSEFPPSLTVPFFIGTLRQELQTEEARAVVDGLRRLTHQNYGLDADRWEIWWEANRARFGDPDLEMPELFPGAEAEAEMEPLFTPAPAP